MTSFFVVQGRLLIDLEGQTIELNPNEGVTISKGVLHPEGAKKDRDADGRNSGY